MSQCPLVTKVESLVFFNPFEVFVYQENFLGSLSIPTLFWIYLIKGLFTVRKGLLFSRCLQKYSTLHHPLLHGWHLPPFLFGRFENYLKITDTHPTVLSNLKILRIWCLVQTSVGGLERVFTNYYVWLYDLCSVLSTLSKGTPSVSNGIHIISSVDFPSLHYSSSQLWVTRESMCPTLFLPIFKTV